jgi:hypothetical protein
MTRRLLSRFLFVVVLFADTILLLWWLSPGYRPTVPRSLPIPWLQAFFFNSWLFWHITAPLVVALGLTVLTEKIRALPESIEDQR